MVLLASLKHLFIIIIIIIIIIISLYQRNTLQTLLFKLFDKLIRLELVGDSQTLSSVLTKKLKMLIILIINIFNFLVSTDDGINFLKASAYIILIN